MLGKLCIVATPIGNLDDISNRAIETLKSAELILAEDTRVTKKLLTRHEVETRLTSYHSHSPDSKKLAILKDLVEGKNLALVSDAGTPGISDPGNELIGFLLDHEPGIVVIPIPGASAIAAALSVCGFDVNKFVFLGFFPKKKRKKILEEIAKAKRAHTFYESPYRLLRTLGELGEALGDDRRVFVGRELTKLHETLYRGTIGEVIEKLESEKLRGEVVVVIEKKK